MNCSPSKAVLRDLHFRMVWFLTEGIKMKFAEKKITESWIAEAGYFKICKNITRQKDTHGGEVCNNATYIYVT